MKKLLITGITGLIGRAVLKKILLLEPDWQVDALIRPHTEPSRYAEFKDKINCIALDLTDTVGLQRHFQDFCYDYVVHIGALRGGRGFDRQTFYRANVMSTEQFAEACLRSGAELIFCSSVGVFGAIPDELPANNDSTRNPDNYYHYTKIQAEKIINSHIMRGLKASILRPSITYGRGDDGFPFTLVKLVDKGIFPMINKRIWIHLCNIETISEAFCWLLRNPHINSLSLNVADREPVQLSDLVNFISRQLRSKNYSSVLSFDRKFFALGEYLSKRLKNELWISRFQLISRSWIYDVRDAYNLMQLTEHYTIPEIQVTIEDYKGR